MRDNATVISPGRVAPNGTHGAPAPRAAAAADGAAAAESRPTQGGAGDRRKKVLAVASGGGHFIQLRRLVPALARHRIVYVTTVRGYRDEVAPDRCYLVNDANIRNKFGLALMAVRLAVIVMWERPDVVISTGAAPGYFAVRMGKLVGARTVWVDSIANADVVSLSGRRVRSYTDLWLTQWPHLSTPDGPRFRGAVI